MRKTSIFLVKTALENTKKKPNSFDKKELRGKKKNKTLEPPYIIDLTRALLGVLIPVFFCREEVAHVSSPSPSQLAACCAKKCSIFISPSTLARNRKLLSVQKCRPKTSPDEIKCELIIIRTKIRILDTLITIHNNGARLVDFQVHNFRLNRRSRVLAGGDSNGGPCEANAHLEVL